MTKRKLTNEEREARRKANNKKLFEKYGHYKGEYGSPEEWKKQAELIKNKFGNKIEALKCLGLKQLPKTLTELKVSYRKAMLEAHPDRGGSHEDAQKINNAFELLFSLLEDK